jgi:hypothetical protein
MYIKNQKFIDKNFLLFLYELLEKVELRKLYPAKFIQKIRIQSYYVETEYCTWDGLNHGCGGPELMIDDYELIVRMKEEVSPHILEFVALTCRKFMRVDQLLENVKISDSTAKELFGCMGFNNFMRRNPSDEMLIWLFDKYPRYKWVVLDVDRRTLPRELDGIYMSEYVNGRLFYRNKPSMRIIKYLGSYINVKALIEYGIIPPNQKWKYLFRKYLKLLSCK